MNGDRSERDEMFGVEARLVPALLQAEAGASHNLNS